MRERLLEFPAGVEGNGQPLDNGFLADDFAQEARTQGGVTLFLDLGGLRFHDWLSGHESSRNKRPLQIAKCKFAICILQFAFCNLHFAIAASRFA
jgi:hypothetical protein